jgi:phage terminase large subunit-like protein
MAAIETLTPAQMVAAHEWICRWDPLPHQAVPDGDWFIWILQWGAGSGKTFTGAQYVRSRIDAGDWRTVNIAGPTWTDTMRTMVQGSAEAPGLMGVWPPHQRPVLRASQDDPHLRCHNGAKIQLFAARSAERFRGPAGDGAWCDEIDAWKPDQMPAAEAFMLLEQRIRIGPDPRIICTTTPKRRGLVATLRERADCTVTRATMWDNAINLHPAYIRSQEETYKGRRIGRQELEGEILPDTENALVLSYMIEDHRVDAAPEMDRVVVGVDPFGGGGDACGIAVAGKGIDGHAYALANRTCKLGPDGWGRRVVDAAIEFDADCIVWEANYGGDMCEHVLRSAMQAMGVTIRTKKVVSSKAKHLRFEPVAVLYERGEMHHVGTQPELEDQITRFTTDGYDGDESPNDADAFVFAVVELFPARRGPSPSDLYGDPVTAEEEAALQ